MPPTTFKAELKTTPDKKATPSYFLYPTIQSPAQFPKPPPNHPQIHQTKINPSPEKKKPKQSTLLPPPPPFPKPIPPQQRNRTGWGGGTEQQTKLNRVNERAAYRSSRVRCPALPRAPSTLPRPSSAFHSLCSWLCFCATQVRSGQVSCAGPGQARSDHVVQKPDLRKIQPDRTHTKVN